MLTPMEAHMAIKKDALDSLLAGVTRRLFSPRTAYSTAQESFGGTTRKAPVKRPLRMWPGDIAIVPDQREAFPLH
jgi:hypothetical protein